MLDEGNDVLLAEARCFEQQGGSPCLEQSLQQSGETDPFLVWWSREDFN